MASSTGSRVTAKGVTSEAHQHVILDNRVGLDHAPRTPKLHAPVIILDKSSLKTGNRYRLPLGLRPCRRTKGAPSLGVWGATIKSVRVRLIINQPASRATMTFDLDTWASSFNPDPDRPSPDWDDPVMAHKLYTEVPKLAFGIGLRAPFGWDESDFMAELQLTLILRSRGKGKWDPARGRAKWSSWACMVMQTRSQNLHRSSVGQKANLVQLCSIEQSRTRLAFCPTELRCRF